MYIYIYMNKQISIFILILSISAQQCPDCHAFDLRHCFISTPRRILLLVDTVFQKSHIWKIERENHGDIIFLKTWENHVSFPETLVVSILSINENSCVALFSHDFHRCSCLLLQLWPEISGKPTTFYGDL